jgi:hypothetical protein
MVQVAKGTFAVAVKPLPFEGVDAATKLGRMSIDKEIRGDLVATTQGQMLTGMTDVTGSAAYVAMERVTGTLHGRRGTFILQHHGVMHRGAQALRVSVVPDSGTEELRGLTGDFTIENRDGQHFYELRYQLPDE